MKAFIFDMDGCLIDSISLWHEAEQAILDEAGIELSKDQRDELNALTVDEAGSFFHERFGVMGSGEEVAQAIVDFMIEAYRTSVHANPGAIELLGELQEAGAKLCVLSSSPQVFLQAGLGCAGLLDFFEPELVLSANDLGMVKRETATYDHVCGLLGVDIADAWLIDDSWYAVATAHEAGLRTVGVYSADNCGTHDELARYCDFVVDDFTQLDSSALLA